MLETDEIFDKIKRVKHFPTLPEVVSYVTELLDNPRVTAREVGDVISQDIAISAKVLKLVNSSFYGFQKSIDTISQAIVVLGFKALKNTVLGVGIINSFPEIDSQTGFNEKGFWLHSVGVATSAKAIAEASGHENPEQVFIAGLLHDVGKLLLAIAFPDVTSGIIKSAQDKKMTFSEAEKEVMSSNHGLIGKWLLERWNFPEDLQEVVRFHHNPIRASDAHQEITDMVCAGDTLCRALEMGNPGDTGISELPEGVWDRLKFSTNRVDSLMKACNENFVKSKALLKAAR